VTAVVVATLFAVFLGATVNVALTFAVFLIAAWMSDPPRKH